MRAPATARGFVCVRMPVWCRRVLTPLISCLDARNELVSERGFALAGLICLLCAGSRNLPP